MGTMSSTYKFQYIFQKNIQCVWWCTTLNNDLRQPQWPSFFKALGWGGGWGGACHQTPPPPIVASRLRCAQLVAPNIVMTQLSPPPFFLGNDAHFLGAMISTFVELTEFRDFFNGNKATVTLLYGENKKRIQRKTGVCVFFFLGGEPNPVIVRWIVRLILHGGPISYFSFQPVLHDWCNKGRGMWYPVCGMIHIKEPLL